MLDYVICFEVEVGVKGWSETYPSCFRSVGYSGSFGRPRGRRRNMMAD